MWSSEDLPAKLQCPHILLASARKGQGHLQTLHVIWGKRWAKFSNVLINSYRSSLVGVWDQITVYILISTCILVLRKTKTLLAYQKYFFSFILLLCRMIGSKLILGFKWVIKSSHKELLSTQTYPGYQSMESSTFPYSWGSWFSVVHISSYD